MAWFCLLCHLFHCRSGSREQDAASSGARGIFTPHGVIDENGRVGVLLSSKALVQLVMNPIVGAVTSHVGYHLPLFVGSINLLVAALCKGITTHVSYFKLDLLLFWHSEDHVSWYILIMKAKEMHSFSNLFDKVLYMLRTCPLSIIGSISKLYTRNRYLSC